LEQGSRPRQPRSDISGHRFGKLTAIKPSHQDSSYRWHWLLVCDCGERVTAPKNALDAGYNKSCGCTKKMPDNYHGMKGSPVYNSWQAIKSRCNNTGDKDYPRYGGRGIAICEAWDAEFMAFYKDMGDRPEWATSIDRIDPAKGYTPENCRWATAKEQANNRRNTRRVLHKGRGFTLSQLSEIHGIDHDILYARIFSHGWSVDRAVSEASHV